MGLPKCLQMVPAPKTDRVLRQPLLSWRLRLERKAAGLARLKRERLVRGEGGEDAEEGG